MFQWTRTDRRLPILLFATALAFAACERKPETPPAAPPTPPPTAQAPPRLPTLPPPALGRADLLLALDAAASAYAAGRPEEPENLTGRRFAIRQAFGCSGAAPSTPEDEAGLASWRWNAKKTAIELSLRPADWTQAPIMADDAHWEAVEGFWLVRPWLRGDGCPAAAANNDEPEGAAPAPASPQTAGLAVVFEHGGSRVGRRNGKAFSFTVRGDPAPQPPANGYRLVLEGRFAAFPGGRAIRCQADSPDRRPLCVVAADVDRVAFEDADGKVLSEWRPA